MDGLLHQIFRNFDSQRASGNMWARLGSWLVRLPFWLKIAAAAAAVVLLVGGTGMAVWLTRSEPPSRQAATPSGSAGQPMSSDKTNPSASTGSSDQQEDKPQPGQLPALSATGDTPEGSGSTAPPAASPAATSGCALPKYPDASCTGVPPGTDLTVVDGDVTVTVDGTVLSGKDIRGCVIVQAKDVTIRKSKIKCTSFYAIASYASSDDGGLLVEDVEIDCDNHNTTGVSYQGLTARRLNIHGCENGLDIYRDVTLTDSFIHDIYEGASGHGDGIQGADGSNSTISHNTIYAGSSTAAINLNNSSGGPTSTNVTIRDNLLAGGAYTLYCPIPATSNFKIINNRFSTRFYPTIGAYGAATDCGGEQQSGNVVHETGAALSL